MTSLEVHWLIALLVFLIIVSGVFSSSETGMMSLNRYKLRHLAKHKKSAKRAAELLKRPDRLLGVVLIGNTFANILASSVATIIAVFYFGDYGVLIATIILTVLILIFSETVPKTFAALYPERIAFPFSGLLKTLLTVLYPLVWLINTVANSLLKLIGVRVDDHEAEPISTEELRHIVHEAGAKISTNHQQILLRVLDLEGITVDDVMVPRNEIYGIDLMDDWATIEAKLLQSPFSHVLMYRDHLDEAVGTLLVQDALVKMVGQQLNLAELEKLATPVHFIPEGTLLGLQLQHFQQKNQYIGIVVDEYGGIKGLVNIDDVLSEIIGEFSEEIEDIEQLITKQKNGSYVVDGRISLRDLNRLTECALPTAGPKTLSGLIIEELEMIPEYPVCLTISGHHLEVLEVVDTKIRYVQVQRV